VYEGSLQDLIDALGRLPGVGPKSAQRLAFHLLQTDAATVENLAKLLLEVKQKVKSCKTCGAVSPIDGIGPDQLRIKELINRVTTEESKEVIVATNPNLEGEATAAYLVRVLESTGVLVTRLASGLPVGGELEYADEVTLGRALKGRRQVS
jgi:recombination protein RecR